MPSPDIPSTITSDNQFCDKRVALFRARCEARALLWQAGEFGNNLHDAVDPLEKFARKLRLNTDLAQWIMHLAFKEVRDDL